MKRNEEIRNEIKKLVSQLFSLEHQAEKFVPGETPVRYAARVYDEKEIQALIESSLDFWLTLGPYGKDLEKKLAKFVGVRFCLLVNSGSSANLLAFSALTSPVLKERRVLPGSEVITVAAGFPTTITPIIHNNCVPVFVDVTQDTKNIDVSVLEEALSNKTRAVMIAHTLGNPFNVDAVIAFCKKHDLFLIEDNCDALGSEYKGKRTGGFGDIATQSFYPPHHITLGEGGAVLTDNALIKKALESLRDWGRDCWCEPGKENTCGTRFEAQYGDLPFGYDHKYVYSHFGYNLKPLDLQAAVGCMQMEKLEGFGRVRRENFKKYYEALKGYEKYFILPKATEGADPSWFGFPLTVREGAPFSRKDIVDFLDAKKIHTRMLFAGNMLRQPAFNEMRQKGEGFRVVGKLKNTDTIMNHTFWIGVYPGLTAEQSDYVIGVFHDFLKGKE